MVNTHSTGVKCQSFITSSHGYCNLRYSVTNNLMFLVRYLTLYLSFLPKWLKVGRTHSTKPRKSRLHRDLQSHNLGFSDKSGWSHELRSGYTMLLMFFLFLTPISFISIPLPSYFHWTIGGASGNLQTIYATRPDRETDSRALLGDSLQPPRLNRGLGCCPRRSRWFQPWKIEKNGWFINGIYKWWLMMVHYLVNDG